MKKTILSSLAAIALVMSGQDLPVPDAVLYEFVFHRVQDQRNIADQIKAKGKDDSIARDYVRVKSGLTPEEYQTLEKVSDACLAQHMAYLAQRGKGQTISADADRKAMDACIQQLHTQLGEARFSVLDAYARSEILPHVFYRQMEKAK